MEGIVPDIVSRSRLPGNVKVMPPSDTNDVVVVANNKVVIVNKTSGRVSAVFPADWDPTTVFIDMAAPLLLFIATVVCEVVYFFEPEFVCPATSAVASDAGRCWGAALGCKAVAAQTRQLPVHSVSVDSPTRRKFVCRCFFRKPAVGNAFCGLGPSGTAPFRGSSGFQITFWIGDQRVVRWSGMGSTPSFCGHGRSGCYMICGIRLKMQQKRRQISGRALSAFQAYATLITDRSGHARGARAKGRRFKYTYPSIRLPVCVSGAPLPDRLP